MRPRTTEPECNVTAIVLLRNLLESPSAAGIGRDRPEAVMIGARRADFHRQTLLRHHIDRLLDRDVNRALRLIDPTVAR